MSGVTSARKLVDRFFSVGRRIKKELVYRFLSCPEDVNFVFVVGCYDSGTTLLNYLLSHHPEVSGLDTEGVALTKHLRTPEMFGWPRMWYKCREKLEISQLEKKPNPEVIKREWAYYFDRSRKVWVEKSIVNSLNIDWFSEYFGDPHFVWVVRNGYAVAEGIRRRTLNRAKGKWGKGTAYPIDMCAKQWVISNQTIEEKLSSVKSWKMVFYEDLTNDTTSVLQEVFEWLPVTIKQVSIPETFKFHSFEQKIQNMNGESISRLSRVDIDQVNSVASEMLIRYGYTLL